jgi:chromosome segregation ATPase
MSLFEELDDKIVDTKDNINKLVDRLNRFGDLDETFQKTSSDLNTTIENLSSSNKTFQELSEALQNVVKSLEEASKVLVASEPTKMISKLDAIESNANDQVQNIQKLGDEIKASIGETSSSIQKLGDEIKASIGETSSSIKQLNEDLGDTKKSIGVKVTVVLIVSIFILLLGVVNTFFPNLIQNLLRNLL